jgi:hypothetical protein
VNCFGNQGLPWHWISLPCWSFWKLELSVIVILCCVVSSNDQMKCKWQRIHTFKQTWVGNAQREIRLKLQLLCLCGIKSRLMLTLYTCYLLV